MTTVTETSHSPITYAVIYVLLLALTVGAFFCSFLHLGPGWHLVVALAFAWVSVILLLVFYMHLSKSPARTWMMAILGFFWLGIMLTLIMNDYLERPFAAY
jgi:caa(3)-type oxidase subunit IV